MLGADGCTAPPGEQVTIVPRVNRWEVRLVVISNLNFAAHASVTLHVQVQGLGAWIIFGGQPDHVKGNWAGTHMLHKGEGKRLFWWASRGQRNRSPPEGDDR